MKITSGNILVSSTLLSAWLWWFAFVVDSKEVQDYTSTVRSVPAEFGWK